MNTSNLYVFSEISAPPPLSPPPRHTTCCVHFGKPPNITQLGQDDLCTLGLGQTHEPGQQVDGGSHGDDLDDLRRLQSAVDMMKSSLFSAIVDIRSRQANVRLAPQIEAAKT